MTLTPRAVRNVWHKVEGVLTRYVHVDDEETEVVDLTDMVSPSSGSVAGITSASFVDVGGAVLSVVTIAGMLLSWLRKKTGTATLKVQFNTTVPEDIVAEGNGVQAVSVTTDFVVHGNTVPSFIGDSVRVEFSTEDAPDEHIGKYLRVTSGTDTCLMHLDSSDGVGTWEYGNTLYVATLIEDLPASLNGAYLAYLPVTTWWFVTPAVVTLGDIINFPMQWIDPTSPDTDYTP
jgi:hypothetical protein